MIDTMEQGRQYPQDKGPCSRCGRRWGDHRHPWIVATQGGCEYFPPGMLPTAILARQRVGGTIGTLDNIS